MSLDNLLRDYARQDLQRFCPATHYWLRDHNPIADRELTEPLLREPVRFGLTPRERIAATALGDLTTYTIRSRAIWDAAYPVRDSDDPTPATGTTFDQEREIWGRREVSRSSALVYARMLGDAQLIEHYQTPVPAPATDTAPEQNTATPAPVEAVGALVAKAGPVLTAPAQGNSTKTPRSDSIDPVIKLAKTKCVDPDKTSEVWAQMQVLAQAEHPPFLTSMEIGLKYHKNGNDAYFTRNALDKRLHPEKRRTSAKRR